MDMDLKTFISESLKQIAQGIQEAQSSDTGAWICPSVIDKEKPQARAPNHHYPHVQEIDFDIAVTVTEDARKEGSARLSVMSVKIGGTLEKASVNSTVSRVRFSLPVRWPIAESPPKGQGKFEPHGVVTTYASDFNPIT